MAFPPILLMLGVPLALAGTSCLGYVDEQDSWHPGFSCQPFTFCCGTCHHRFCCRDQSLLIPEFQQKRCLGLSPKVTAGIASAVMLFVALMATAVCCFCTCCYLSRRRQQLQVPFADVPLVVEAELGQRAVLQQGPEDGQDALARDVVGVQVEAGDGGVGLEHDGDGEGHVVVGAGVGQREHLDHGVELQGLGEAHQDLAGDAVRVVDVDLGHAGVVVPHPLQGLIEDAGRCLLLRRGRPLGGLGGAAGCLLLCSLGLPLLCGPPEVGGLLFCYCLLLLLCVCAPTSWSQLLLLLRVCAPTSWSPRLVLLPSSLCALTPPFYLSFLSLLIFVSAHTSLLLLFPGRCPAAPLPVAPSLCLVHGSPDPALVNAPDELLLLGRLGTFALGVVSVSGEALLQGPAPGLPPQV
uniref:Shisa family member 4 n=1 Tax=Molossus molossus TaxID=27622 RepID=A0A7J8BMS3_MOLMO|nr:shisa family member 4 [Molossus molossus]